MSVDYNTAKHICNVVRRQVQASFPDLYLHFTIHGEDNRKREYLRDSKIFEDLPAGNHLLEYPNKDEVEKILSKNQSRFICMARQNSPGFLGFFINNDYVGLCFINHDRFSSEENLRNQALNIAWHAISIYKDYIRRKSAERITGVPRYIDEHNLLIPQLSKMEICFRNLGGDIFSACVQMLQGRTDAIEHIARQRVHDTLNVEKGFRSEYYPFPSFIDTLNDVLHNQIKSHKNNRKTIQAAVKIAEQVAKTYENISLEGWQEFSLPAQQMAWAGHSQKTILGVAVYTSTNTQIQSDADTIAEWLGIKPALITNFDDYNPFMTDEKNEQLHIQRCKELIKSALTKIKVREDYTILLEIARKQNILLLEKSVIIGWCGGALLRASEIIRHCTDPSLIPALLKQAEEIFLSEVENIKWDTLEHFSKKVFNELRKGELLTPSDLLVISAQNDEFSSLHHALSALDGSTDIKGDIDIKTVIDHPSSTINVLDMIKTNGS